MKEQENALNLIDEKIKMDTFVPEMNGDAQYTSARLTQDFGTTFMSLRDVLFDVNAMNNKNKSKDINLTPEEEAAINDYNEFDNLITESMILFNKFIDEKGTMEGTVQEGFGQEKLSLIKQEYNKDLDAILDKLIAATEKNMAKLNPDSYRYKLCKFIVRHVKIARRPDFHNLMSQNSTYNSISSGVIHLPGADFVNEDGSRTYDFDKYEKLSKDYPQIDLMLNEQDFLINHVLPYNEVEADKKDSDSEYKQAYIDHHLKQAKIISTIASKTQEEVVATKSVKYTDYNTGWVQGVGGVRYAGLLGDKINEDLAYLNGGWEPHEIEMLHELKAFKADIKKLTNDKADPYFVKNGDKIIEAVENILEGKVRSEDDRIRLFRELKPYVDKYNEYRNRRNSGVSFKLVNYEIVAGKYKDFALSSELENIDDIDKLYEFSDDPSTMNQARVNRIERILHYTETPSELVDFTDYVIKHSVIEDFKACGFTATAGNRNAGVFFAYMMGVKQLDYTNATKIKPGHPDFESIYNDFNKFIKDNAYDNLKGDAQKQAAANLINMFKDAADKFNSYQLPDIDYSDAKVMEDHRLEFSELCSVMINVTQEFELMVKHMGHEKAKEHFGGKSKEGVIASFYALNDFGSEYREAYSPFDISGKVKAIPNQRKKYYGICATNRVHLAQVTSKIIRGKKVSEIIKGSGVLNLYEREINAEMSARPITEGAKEYLVGKSDNFAKAYEKRYKVVAEEYRLEYNARSGIAAFAEGLSDTVNKFMSEGEGYVAANGLAQLCGNVDTTNNISELKEYNDDTKKATKLINDSFDALYNGDDAYKIYDLIGVNDPLDLIKIDGKTPKELWGDEYANLSENDKQFMLKARVVNEMILGGGDVTVDSYIINEKNEFVKSAPYKVAKSRKTIDNEIAFYKGIDDVHVFLDDLKKKLVSTQNNPDANFAAANTKGAITSGSDSYKKMTAALNKCIRATDLNSKEKYDYNMSYEQLESALKELKAAAVQYGKSHDSGFGWLVSGYRHNGKVRIGVAKDLSRELDYKIESLKDLSYNNGIRKNKNVKHSLPSNKLKDKWGKLKQEANTKNITIKDNVFGKGGHAEEIVGYGNAVTKDLLRREVMKVSKNRTKSEVFVEVLDNPFEVNAYEIARRYFRNKYLSKIRKAESGIGTHKVNELSEVITSAEFKDIFNNEVTKLAENEVFADLVKKNSKTAISEWNKIVENEANTKFNSLATDNNVYKGLVKQYPKHAKDIWLVAEDRLENWKRKWSQTEARIANVKVRLTEAGSPYTFDRHKLFEDVDERYNKNKEDYLTYRTLMVDEVADILAYSFAKDNADKPDFMGMVINTGEFEKTKAYIKEGLENDVFQIEKPVEEIIERLNNIDSLKIAAMGYVKQGVDKEKASLNKNAEVKKEANKEVKKEGADKNGPHF